MVPVPSCDITEFPLLVGGDEDGLAVQQAAVGGGMHGRGLRERPAIGDLDAHLAVVNTADQLCQLSSVATDENPLAAHATAGICRIH